ncbi:MAG: sulfurtransferase [Mogibacterium sp.]|nr:sulfurtransferase [Mogibacterium sp.]
MSELKYFVDAAWLLEHLNDEDVFIIDSRFDLFDPAGYGAKAYAEAHIAGAYYFDIDQDITENKGEHGGRRGTADPAVLAAKLAAIGVTNDSTIVCYDDGVYSAPRAWWQFRYMGLDKVYVLDGGFYGWKQNGYPVSAEPTAPRGEGCVTCSMRDEMFADKDYVVAAMGDPDKVIVDARGHKRYTGEVEPLYSKRGHIPGAINIHYLTNMKDGEIEWLIGTPEQWKANFAPVLGKESVLYCGSAIEAAINYMFLEELGERARLYIGSMSDWVGYDDLAVEGDY